MDINIFSEYFSTFLLILLRTSIFVSLLPVLGAKQLPPQFKMGMAVFIAIILTPVVKFEVKESEMAVLVLMEVLLGVALALVARFVFMAVTMAGIFISHIMGMSIARVFNPEVGQSTHIAEVYGVMTMLFFLIMNAHHDLLYVFVRSFEILPAGQFDIRPVVPELVKLGSKIFILSLKIAAPVLIGLFISNILTGMLSKAAPQLNIFFIAMPMNIFIGFVLIILSIPVFEYIVNVNFSNLKGEMARILMLAKG